jgi:ribosome maturation factor RimP
MNKEGCILSGNKIENLVYELARPFVETMGFELAAVEYLKEGPNWFLRLYIDKEGGVDLDDCQAVSQEISELLDEKDPIPQSYFLEVSSPGVERILQTERDFDRFRNELVNVALYSPLEGKKKHNGRLGPVTEDRLTLLLDGDKNIELPREKIAQVRIAWKE